jgi:hypothetical protein
MNKKIYYKITNYELGSWITENKAYVQYKVWEFVTAPDWLASQGYHLLVFDNIKDAKHNFCHLNDILWKCEVKDIQEGLPACHYVHEINNGFLSKSNTKTIMWPAGTIMVKAVKLIKEIKC